jgi:hypothetical protein
MSAIDLIEDYGRKYGLSTLEQLELACEYIANQESDDVLVDFLAEHAARNEFDDADDPYGRRDRDLLQDVRDLQAMTGMDDDELIQHALLMIDEYGLSRMFMDVLGGEEDDHNE